MATFTDFRPGDEPVAGYRLVRQLVTRPDGAVWAAVAAGSGKRVAVRFHDLSVPDGGLRDLRAVRLAQRLSHPHLVTVLAARLLDRKGGEVPLDDADATDRAAVLAVVAALGEDSLADRLRELNPPTQPPAARTGFPAEEAVGYADGAAKALDFLNSPYHGLGNEDGPIIHAAVKPGNLIRIGKEVLVTDAHAAAAVGPETPRPGDVRDPVYAPPELAVQRPGPGTDQYMLAVTYYELRTGRPPVPAGLDRFELVKLHAAGRLDFTSPAVSDAERRVLRWATARVPEQRYATCREFVKQLRRATGDGEPLDPRQAKAERKGLPVPAALPLPGTSPELPPVAPSWVPAPSEGGVRQTLIPPPADPPPPRAVYEPKPVATPTPARPAPPPNTDLTLVPPRPPVTGLRNTAMPGDAPPAPPVAPPPPPPPAPPPPPPPVPPPPAALPPKRNALKETEYTPGVPDGYDLRATVQAPADLFPVEPEPPPRPDSLPTPPPAPPPPVAPVRQNRPAAMDDFQLDVPGSKGSVPLVPVLPPPPPISPPVPEIDSVPVVESGSLLVAPLPITGSVGVRYVVGMRPGKPSLLEVYLPGFGKELLRGVAEPVLPGCEVYPQRQEVTSKQPAAFTVVPRVTGPVAGTVTVRRGGDVYAVAQIPTTVRGTTAGWAAAGAAVLVPLMMGFLQTIPHDDSRKLGPASRLATLLVRDVPPEVYGVGLLAAAAGLFVWARPRTVDRVPGTDG